MKKIYLSETEKRMLKALNVSQYEKGQAIDMSQAELNAASRRLEELGFIKANYSEGSNLFAARILDEGIVYLKENQALDNPFDDEELKRLQKKNLELSNNEMEYKKQLRRQESIIRYWKLACAVIGLIGLTGWMFVVFNFI
jgi:hypothetical protein